MSTAEHTRYTDRLLLRPPVEGDAHSLYAIYGDPLTNRYNPAGPYPDLDKARSVLADWIGHWRRHGFGQWAICRRDDPSDVIGYGGIGFRMYVDEEKLNLGYRFGVGAWGRGYATELGRMGLDHAFRELRQPEVFAIVRPANRPSIRVLEKLGMKLAGDLDDVPGEPPSLLFRSTMTDYLSGRERASSSTS